MPSILLLGLDCGNQSTPSLPGKREIYTETTYFYPESHELPPNYGATTQGGGLGSLGASMYFTVMVFYSGIGRFSAPAQYGEAFCPGPGGLWRAP